MKNLGKTLVCGITALFAVTAMADAPTSAKQFTPKLMNYQGYLADPSTGKPYVDGIYNLECRLYRVATDGTAIWGGEYSVYVKDGYFNIMLGDASANDLEDCTYANTNLWCALWSDASVTDENERNNLWLGVTPLQNSRHNAITSPAEIRPRQQLLTAPYAFRAQSAEYANESPGDFKVNGALYGQGNLKWKSTATDTYKKPFIIKDVNLTIPAGSNSKYYILGDSEYNYCVGSFRVSGTGIGVDSCYVIPEPPSQVESGRYTRWVIEVRLKDAPSVNTIVTVTLFGVLNELVDDQR